MVQSGDQSEVKLRVNSPDPGESVRLQLTAMVSHLKGENKRHKASGEK